MADRSLPTAMDGKMKRELLTVLLASIPLCGCAGRMDADLLQARIREQTIQLDQSQRELAKTRSELERTRLEAERFKSELDQLGQVSTKQVIPPISKLRFHTLSSGGLNKDDHPGDDAVVVNFVPLTSDNEPSQVPGAVDITLVDPMLAKENREIGHWTFTTEECRSRWTRGITSSGYQFSLPLEKAPAHPSLVVIVRFTTADDRHLESSQMIKVVMGPINSSMHTTVPKRVPVQTPVKHVDESDEFLPPVGDGEIGQSQADGTGWDDDVSESPKSTPGRAVLHSANWTDATIPQWR